MESAGASKEEIEEMMSMIMNKGGGISQDFVENIKKAMAMGAGRTPEQTLEMLKDAMEEEMNSVTTCLRNTFLNRYYQGHGSDRSASPKIVTGSKILTMI